MRPPPLQAHDRHLPVLAPGAGADQNGAVALEDGARGPVGDVDVADSDEPALGGEVVGAVRRHDRRRVAVLEVADEAGVARDVIQHGAVRADDDVPSAAEHGLGNEVEETVPGQLDGGGAGLEQVAGVLRRDAIRQPQGRARHQGRQNRGAAQFRALRRSAFAGSE